MRVRVDRPALRPRTQVVGPTDSMGHEDEERATVLEEDSVILNQAPITLAFCPATTQVIIYNLREPAPGGSRNIPLECYRENMPVGMKNL